jgi:signal peptidase I
MGDFVRKRFLSDTFGYFKALFWAILIALAIKTSIAEAYLVPTPSMEDTLLVGDFVVANKFIYGAKVPFTRFRFPAIRPPRQGDIITFRFPGDLQTNYVKRCVATEGQVVEIRDKALYVDGFAFSDPEFSKHLDSRIFAGREIPRDNFGPYRVPPGMVFAMGDNRDNSYDSRFWGPVPLDLIEGKAILIQWSIAPDEDAPGIDLADLGTIPRMVWHEITHFAGRIRWDRFLKKVG